MGGTESLDVQIVAPICQTNLVFQNKTKMARRGNFWRGRLLVEESIPKIENLR